MKINEVEQLAGITKKNIRFYEDAGLITPSRDKSNGYREYSDDDVALLLKIRLLRRLCVPIEEIRKLFDGRLTLGECMERQMISLNHERHNYELMGEMCRNLLENETGLYGMDTEKYLRQIDEMEKEGIRFMNVSKADVKKKKRGARIAALVMIALMLAWDLIFWIAGPGDGMPVTAMILMTVLPTAVIAGIVIALRQRIKEIDKGEEYEAADY